MQTGTGSSKIQMSIQLNQEQVSPDFSRERNATGAVKFSDSRTHLYKDISRKEVYPI